jgi:CRP-like cAMP-binding protein
MSSSEGNHNPNQEKPCEFKDNLSILRETYFFSSLPLEVLKILAYLCVRENFKAENYLFRQGEDDGQAIAIISGTAALYHQHKDKDLFIKQYMAGSFLGGLSLTAKMQRLFSLKAESDLTALILTREKFNTAMRQFEAHFPRILNSLVQQITHWEERALHYSFEHCETVSKEMGVSLL